MISIVLVDELFLFLLPEAFNRDCRLSDAWPLPRQFQTTQSHYYTHREEGRYVAKPVSDDSLLLAAEYAAAVLKLAYQ